MAQTRSRSCPPLVSPNIRHPQWSEHTPECARVAFELAYANDAQLISQPTHGSATNAAASFQRVDDQRIRTKLISDGRQQTRFGMNELRAGVVQQK
jgi:hypothetical protein